jgi:hypothetical protein
MFIVLGDPYENQGEEEEDGEEEELGELGLEDKTDCIMDENEDGRRRRAGSFVQLEYRYCTSVFSVTIVVGGGFEALFHHPAPNEKVEMDEEKAVATDLVSELSFGARYLLLTPLDIPGRSRLGPLEIGEKDLSLLWLSNLVAIIGTVVPPNILTSKSPIPVPVVLPLFPIPTPPPPPFKSSSNLRRM